jgi:signal transduction histidine kinase
MSEIAKRRSAVPLASAVFVLAIAAGALVGWWSGSPTLAALYTGLAPMPFDTAFGLFAGALGMVCVDRERRAPVRVAIVFLIALGGTALLEQMTGLPVALQRLLLPAIAPAAAQTEHMAPNAALALVLFGVALSEVEPARHDRIHNVALGVVAGGVEVLGVFALLGHAFGLDPTYGWGRLMSMAPHTAVAITALGLGPVALAWRKSAADRAQYGPSVAVTALAGMVGSILLAGLLLSDDVRFRRELVVSELAHVEGVARRITEAHVLELERIARYTRGAPAAQREPIAKGIVFDSEVYESMLELDADGSLAWAVPAESAPRERDEGAVAASTRLDVLRRGSTDLLAIRVPLDGGGTLVGIVSAQRLLQRAFDEADIRAAVLVSGDAGEIYASDPDAPRARRSESRALQIRDVAWTIRGWPSDAQLVRTTPPLLALGGGMLLTLVAVYALSQRRTALERAAAMEQVSHQLTRSNEELGRFAYIASHDLQEPLRIVTSFCTRLDEKYAHSLDDSARTYIGFIVEAADRMGELIEGLLRYSRIEGQTQQLEPVDCNEAFADALAALRALVADTAAEVRCDRLPIVTGSRMLLAQLFQNLIANAIKYTGEKRPEVHVSVAERGDHWEFSVKDNGIGIHPRHQHKIFEMFARLSSETGVSGTGIGLALCRKVVERLGGAIWVASSPGEGSTFFFSLPRLRASAVAEPVE